MWQRSSGLAALFPMPNGGHSFSWGFSGDGRTIVGELESLGKEEAFRWTAEGGKVGLGDLPGGLFESQARAASHDGSVIVGYGVSENGHEAFRWKIRASS